MTIDEVLSHPFLASNQMHSAGQAQMVLALSNMVRLSRTPRLYSLVMASAARQMDHTKVPHLTKVFNVLDRNHDGVLDMAESRAALESAFGQSSQEVCQVQQIFN